MMRSNRRRPWRKFASRVYERDGFTCWLCNTETLTEYVMGDPLSPSLDHVVPRSRGGDDAMGNLRPVISYSIPEYTMDGVAASRRISRRIFQRLGKYVPAGTISLTTHYFATPEDLEQHSDGYVLGTARARRFHQGYFDQTAELWTEGGILLATSHQMVYYKV